MEIIFGLLNANKIEYETRLTNTYEKREYCVQYDESDFDLFHDYWKMKEYFIFLRSKMATTHSF